MAARRVLMVRPGVFFANPETAGTNVFQQDEAVSLDEVRAEFDGVVAALRTVGVDVLVIEGGIAPDEVFPNNWLSTHGDSGWVLYPMMAESRRQERRPDVRAFLEREYGAGWDLSGFEGDGRYLEGTGSLVIDHREGVAYAARSARTDEDLVREWAARFGMEAVVFEACSGGVPVYHTNVVMGIGERWSVVCQGVIEGYAVAERLRETGRVVVEISEGQMREFWGNVIELEGAGLVISRRGWAALEVADRARLEAVTRVTVVGVDSIERIGGGGVRCMIAELF